LVPNVLSKAAVDKEGFVQREIKLGLRIMGVPVPWTGHILQALEAAPVANTVTSGFVHEPLSVR